MAARTNPPKPSTIQAHEQARSWYGRRETEPGHPPWYAERHTQTGWSQEEEVKMPMTRYMVVVEQGETSWGAHVPDLPGCVAVGEGREEVLRLIREAIELHIDGLRQDGLAVPTPSSEGEFVEVGAA